jgi:hypothetical protein
LAAGHHSAGVVGRVSQRGRFPIHGFGPVRAVNRSAEWSELNAHIVLERGISAEQFGEFLAWLQSRDDVEIAWIRRTGDEQYVP